MERFCTVIRINLLPPELRPFPWSPIRLLLGGLLLMSAVLGGVSGYYFMKIDRLEKQLAMLEQQRQLLQPVRQDMSATVLKQREQEMKYAAANRIRTERRSYYGIVAYLGLITPDAVRLTEVMGNEENQLLLKGIARNYSEAQKYFQRLEQEEFFCDPVLVKVESDRERMNTLFEMSVKLSNL